MSPTQRFVAAVSLGVAAVAGGVAVVAPLLPKGLVLGGSACGGGGEEQRCTGIARQLSLVDVSPRAWLFVAGGALSVLLAGVGLVLLLRVGRSPLAVALALVVLAFAGLVQAENVQGRLGPEGGGTYARTLEDWGPLLSPALADLRQDSLRRYAGTRTEPGGPLYDREQILDSFSVLARGGWRLLHGALVVLFFASLLAVASGLIASAPRAVALTGTAGLVLWAVVVDRATPCFEGASDCYDGLLTTFAVGLALMFWLVYGVAVMIANRVRR